MSAPSVMVGIPVRNASLWLRDNINCLESMTYPKDKVRVVYLYGNSYDNTLEILREYSKTSTVKVEVYREPVDQLLKQYGIQMGASIYRDFQSLLEEDYFMLFDSDIIKAPPNLIEALLEVKEDVVAPYPWNENYTHFYDNWIFRIGNKRFHPIGPPGLGMNVPIEVDSVGTCLLAKKEVFKNTPIENPYPNLSFCNNARARGHRVLAVPFLEVIHKDVSTEQPHLPLPQEMGGYPLPVWATALDPVIDVNGNVQEPYSNVFPFDSNPEIQQIERTVALRALKTFYTSSFSKERHKSLKWLFNYFHFGTFWMTRDPNLISIMYRTEMYPKYIEIELSNMCNYRCKWCELPHWKGVTQRNMTWTELMIILDNFPDLKQLAFVGIGNPWLNPIFLDAIKYVKKERDLFFELYDPFQNFTVPIVKKFIKWGVERLIVSLDAATKKTYESNRVGHKWDKMIEAVKLFDKYKKKYNSRYPEINFHFVINRNNIHEALDCIDFVKSLNIENGFIQYSRLLHCFPEIEDMYMEVPSDLCSKIMAKARKEKVPIAWNANVDPNMPPMSQCVALWQPGFLATGEVTVCCVPKDTTVFGSNKPIQDIKRGDKVLSSIGTEQKVTQTFHRKYSGKLYTIKPMGLSPVSFTSEHPILVIKRPDYHVNRSLATECCRFMEDHCETRYWSRRGMRWKPEWKLPSEIETLDYLLVPIPREHHDINIESCKVRIDDDYWYIPVEKVDVTSVDNLDVYNIETEDNSYTVPFIVHNCSIKEANTRNWERKMSMGNIFIEHDFKKIWYGERYRKLRQQIREGKCPEPCMTCPIYKRPDKVEFWD